YVGIVVGVGALVGSRGNLPLSILATAVIALAFQPMRDRARHFANRLVYGKRSSPYEAMSEFAERVAGTYSLDEVLLRMARIAAEGTGAEGVEVWVLVGEGYRRETSWPEDHRGTGEAVGKSAIAGDHVVEVSHRREELGAIAVTMPRNEGLSPAGEKLLSDLASQAGLVLRNVRLIEELRASRQRLVAAQDDERRRLERNIHDGAQQQLVALSVKLRLAENLARKDPDKAAAIMAEVRSETQQALEDLRDLA
ncbi:MAG TPA: histidine kinase dimerization/phosphoacceptor domain-containing protein, partial [Actinomycetota bacterium]|nr:histidine kinase dimerization/phosphoacceptor domain-containing protein [Actinomycetota bacterium]